MVSPGWILAGRGGMANIGSDEEHQFLTDAYFVWEDQHIFSNYK